MKKLLGLLVILSSLCAVIPVGVAQASRYTSLDRLCNSNYYNVSPAYKASYCAVYAYPTGSYWVAYCAKYPTYCAKI